MLTPLDAFGIALSKLRKEAIDGRMELAIENEWLEDEEAFLGIDDANRHEFLTVWRQLKPTASGRWSTNEARRTLANAVKSSALINITRPYCEAAAKRLADMLLPSDDRCWGIEPTPIPELAEGIKSDNVISLGTGEQIEQAELAEALTTAAKKYADEAERQIEDWLVECGWYGEVRTVIDDSARVGTGVLKGPYPTRKKAMARSMAGIYATSRITPASCRVDVWNCFPDPACGENIHDGQYFWERDYITAKRLLKLVGTPGYIPEQILSCVNEGPQGYELDWSAQRQSRAMISARTPFEIWYFHGLAERDEVEAAGLQIRGQFPGNLIPVIATMVNHRVVKVALNPLDDGTFPYDFFNWSKRAGLPYGVGVARQMRVPQRMVTAAVRNLNDNAALSAGPQIVINSKVLRPADGKWEIVPRKVWIANEDADLMDLDVEKAFKVFHIETRQEDLLNIVNLGLRFAEESTGMPAILQGQMGEKAPDTLGGMTMLQNNATAVIRGKAKTFDDTLTKPHIQRFYNWLMQYSTNDMAKGDLQVVAKGSSTLVERDLQNQELLLMGNMVLNPAFGLDPKKYAEEWLRSRRFDPKRFKYDPAQQRALDSAQPTDPRIEAANIKAQSDAEGRKVDVLLKGIDAELERMRLAGEREINYDNLRAKLQEALLKINSAHQLFNAESKVKEKEGSGI